ncbi:MAG: flavodoxin domain-containing protein [Anaerolineaceae bacterium]
MEKKILVAYASVHGSTREIAEVIAKTLKHDGVSADIQPASKVTSLEGYDMVILGAPQYMFHLQKDALRFLKKFRKIIENGLPVAIFAGGSIEKDDAEERQIIRDRLEQELAQFSWFKPASMLIVGGRFNPNNLRFPYNLIPALKTLPPVDYRVWPAIQTWAQTLPTVRQTEVVESAK